MSIILDALRKSEDERQQGRPPRLADVRQAARPQSSWRWWPLLMVGVLLLNLLLLMLLLRDRAPASPPPGAVAPAVPEITRLAPPAAPADELREVRPLAREPLPRTPQATSARAPQPAARAPGGAAAAPARPAAVLTELEPELPSAADLVARGRLNIPELTLELHVYAEEAGRRLVFINGSRYREGDRLQEGPLLEAVTASGAVLRHEGERFLLPRP
ncbi:MAG: general secretion pathway protein GspB [Chromatiales bacterium]|nr:general secretion pathway protein GspB [Chromatiales bacterium]